MPSSEELHQTAAAHLNAGRLPQAVEAMLELRKLMPSSPVVLNNLGAILGFANRLEESVEAFEAAAKIDPNYADSFAHLGNSLRRLGRLEEAVAACQRAIRLQPDHAMAYDNLGVALRHLNRLDEALDASEIANSLGAVSARTNAAQVLLMRGDFERGWPMYEGRWLHEQQKNSARNFNQPMWTGGNLQRRTVLLHAEQGLGDTIQFSRYAPLVKSRGAKVILEVQPPLKKLMSNLTGPDVVIAKGEPLPPFDVHAPLLSLPLAFHTTLETIPHEVPYILPISQPPEEIQNASGFKVGLVWAGLATHANDRNRSLPLRAFEPILKTPGVSFFSLQKETAAAQIAEMKDIATIVDLGPTLQDFTDTAAAISGLDLVIAVDTSVVHLAGAMGKKVWTLLPFSPDWRWLMDRSDTPWYPTMRLFRQPKPRDWTSVIDRIASELRARVQ